MDAMTALVGLIDDLKAARAAGKSDTDLKTALYLQRRAQFYFDFIEAENSTGFHAPQEAARVLGNRSTSPARVRSPCVTQASSRRSRSSIFRRRRPCRR